MSLPSPCPPEGRVAGGFLFSLRFGTFGEVSAKIRWKDSSRFCFSSGDRNLAGLKKRGMSSKGPTFPSLRSLETGCGGACLLDPRATSGGEPTLRSPNASEMICCTGSVGAASGVEGGALTPLPRGLVRNLLVIGCAVFMTAAACGGVADVVLVRLKVFKSSGSAGDRGDIGVDGPAFFHPAEVSIAAASCIVTSSAEFWLRLLVFFPLTGSQPDGVAGGSTGGEGRCSPALFAFIDMGLDLVKAVRFL